jgi:hypothetical protein
MPRSPERGPWDNPEYYARLWAYDTGGAPGDPDWDAAYQQNLSDLRAEAGRRDVEEAQQRQEASAAWHGRIPGDPAAQMASIQDLHVEAARHKAAGRMKEALAAALELDRIRGQMIAASTYSRDWEFPEEAAAREEFYRQHGTPFHNIIYPTARAYFAEEYGIDIDELGADQW